MVRFPVSMVGQHLARISAVVVALLAISIAILSTRADDTPATDAPATDAPATAPPKVAPPKFIPMKPEAATKTLTDKGLKKLKPTATAISWVLSDDATVCEKLAEFSKLAAAHRAAAKATKAKSIEISKDSDVLSKAEARYTELKGYAEKPETIPRKIMAHFRSQQEMLQALQQDLNDQITTINKLRPKVQGQFAGDLAGSLKAAIVEWMTARNNLILGYATALAEFADLDKRYHDLADDADVATALKSLGKKNHLGSPEFEQIQKAMTAAAATIDSGEVPFYREGALDTVGAVLNDTLPVAMRIQSVQPNSPNWAPTELLAKAGIKVDPASPEVTLNISGNGNRSIKCRQVIVPKLRIGKFMLENLQFLAMPDDAKDLGLQISSNALKSYDQTPDRETWLYKFVKQAEPKPDDSATPAATPPKPDDAATPAAAPPKPDEK
jgi:hypothetical protein